MPNSSPNVPTPKNEPVRGYAPGSPERASLEKRLAQLAGREIDVPLVIGGKRIRTGKLAEMRCPHDHSVLLGKYHKGGKKEVERAVAAANKAWPEWGAMPWELSLIHI